MPRSPRNRWVPTSGARRRSSTFSYRRSRPVPEPTRIGVSAERPYDVLVGQNLLAELPGLLGEDVRRVAVIHPPTLVGLAGTVVRRLSEAGYTALRIDVPDA